LIKVLEQEFEKFKFSIFQFELIIIFG